MTPAISRYLRGNQKTFGILGFLALVFLGTALIDSRFLGTNNLLQLFRYTGLYGLIAVGVTFVIITGGIDLSIGAVIGLTGVLFPRLLVDAGIPVIPAMGIVMVISLAIGLINGLLITQLRLQPFLVTLCGLFVYRGIAQGIGGGRSVGFGSDFTGLRAFLVKYPVLPIVPSCFVVLLIVAIVASVFLNRTVYGRYLLALGSNEEAARFSGINTNAMKIVSYLICSGLAGFAGMMFVLDVGSATGSTFGNFYELYAIAGAVLGGCSLRGGEGAIAGVVLGAALVQIVERAVLFIGVPDTYKLTVLGVFILLGVIVDELLNRILARRRAVSAARV